MIRLSANRAFTAHVRLWAVACLILPGCLPRAEAQSHMQGMAMQEMEATETGGGAPAATRDPHAYADGYDFGPLAPPRLAGEEAFGALLVDRLEWVRTADSTAMAYELRAWYGRDNNGAVLKAEGGIDANEARAGRAELLWGHALSPFWDTQFGVRNDHGGGAGRNWLALGIQGIAPYGIELAASGYLREGGRGALRLEGEYELLLTQRLILQTRLEMNLYDKDDAERDLGAGLADTAAGLRLRYRVWREFAPYVGIEWAAEHNGTAGFALAAGEAAHETRLVAGVRLFF